MCKWTFRVETCIVQGLIAFKGFRQNPPTTQNSVPVKFFFKHQQEMKTFPIKEKLRALVVSSPIFKKH